MPANRRSATYWPLLRLLLTKAGVPLHTASRLMKAKRNHLLLAGPARFCSSLSLWTAQHCEGLSEL